MKKMKNIEMKSCEATTEYFLLFYFPLFNSNRYYGNEFYITFTMFHVKCKL